MTCYLIRLPCEVFGIDACSQQNIARRSFWRNRCSLINNPTCLLVKIGIRFNYWFLNHVDVDIILFMVWRIMKFLLLFNQSFKENSTQTILLTLRHLHPIQQTNRINRLSSLGRITPPIYWFLPRGAVTGNWTRADRTTTYRANLYTITAIGI